MVDFSKIYTEKQLKVFDHFIKNPDLDILILHGAKRAGKTIIDNDLFMSILRKVKKNAAEVGVDVPQFILAASSLGALDRNVFLELKNRWGIDITLDKKNTFMLFGVRICCFGHDNIGALRNIRGMTSFGAYINEGSMAHEEVFDEIISRCSGKGAIKFIDTNPGHPKHWLKEKYIDKADQKIISQFHFQLDDNTFIDERYRENIKKTTPTGMFYDRNILGLWVSGDGVIYKDYDQKKHKVSSIQGLNFIKYFCGVDWGYDHYGSMGVFGLTDDYKVYLIKELSRRHQDIDFWVSKAKKIKEIFGDVTFYCDSARPEYVQAMINAGINAQNANKSVLEGITTVATLMKNDRFFVYEKGIEIFEDEIYSYVWADGKDEPVKKNDDSMDMVRYAIHSELSDFDKATAIEGLNL